MWVIGAAIISADPEVNPSLAIMAIAQRAMVKTPFNRSSI
jgi:choline dehydrogenase-like flavoprotein